LTPSSTASSTCRIDWRPSRWLLACLVALGLLAAGSLLMSAIPRVPAVLSAVAAMGWAGWLAGREAHRPRGVLVLAGQGDSIQWQQGPRAEVLHDARWQQRGPLLVLRARDDRGAGRSFCWCPDTLSPASRRQLRLHRDLSSRYDNPLPSVAA
jgi:toxin CptA